MPNTATVYLPLNTFVSVACYTNASFQQQVTITPETGSPTVLTGSGEHNAPMPGGTFSLTTPSSSQSPYGYRMTVSVQSMQPNGQWAPSQVSQGSCAVMYYSLAMVVSEDYLDQDWNDAVVQFSWWIPPSARSDARADQIKDAHQ
ncbi:fucose-binding lectin II [Variovorax paradoxus]|uniref:fucose-binding lectin II n=1 Tax=Variovorax paradoxus TaxID=34073 RepID=UPI003D647AA5